jgi:putative hemolysin
VRLGRALARVPPLAPYANALGIGLVVLAITYLSLVVGELVPKQLALGDPEGIAARLARPMRTLAVLAAPAVRLLSASAAAVVRLLGVRPSTEPAVTAEELAILVEQGAQAGVIQAAERDLVDRVFRLGDRRVRELMTPRPRVVWLDADAPPEETRRRLATGGHSAYPVCRGDLDHVLGIVALKDLWAPQLAGQPLDLTLALRQPLFIPEQASAFLALENLKAAGTRLALVLDEFGGVEGLLTLADLVEDLVGDVEAAAPGDPRAVRRPDGSWLVDGMLPLDELRAIFPLGPLPGEEEGFFQTVGGFILSQLGRLPRAGDRVEWGGLRFEVLDMDGQRVDKVLVTPAPDDRRGP